MADNLSDDVLLLDPATGTIEKRFDLAESDAVPATYPIALAVTKDGKRAFVALWNASEIVELDLANGTVGRKLALLKPSSPDRSGNTSLRACVSRPIRKRFMSRSPTAMRLRQ